MANLLLSEQFAKALNDLDGSVYKKVANFQRKMLADPDGGGLDLKIPNGAQDNNVRTARVDQQWRAVLIALPLKDAYLLWTIKNHDDAYECAERLKVTVNEINGALEVVEVGRPKLRLHSGGTTSAPRNTQPMPVDEVADDTVTTQTLVQPEAPAPCLAVSIEDLVGLGIDAEVADQVVEFTDEGELLDAIGDLPGVQDEIIMDLATGSTLDEVRDRYVHDHVDPEDFEAALHRYGLQLVDDDDEDRQLWEDALAGDFQAWRVWLHPLQRRLAYHDGWNGPFRVTGGAGTGKTITAIHRARHLASRPRETPGHSRDILFTTFTRNLSDALTAQLEDLAGPDVDRRVEVRNIDAVTQQVLRSTGDRRRWKIVGDADPEIQRTWEQVIRESDNTWTQSFLSSEWNDVILAHGVSTLDDYLTTARRGRGQRLTADERRSVWPLIERFQSLLPSARVTTFIQAASDAAQILAANPDLPRYRHGIVDEAQDLHPAHWRLLRALVTEGTDDLFIVGDAHQRIYGSPVVLSHQGINTVGRGKRLTVNYRTSREILRWCLAALADDTADDLEGDPDTLRGARSVFSGPEPLLRPCGDLNEEMATLTEVLKDWHANDIDWAEMGVFARTKGSLKPVLAALRNAGIPAVEVTGDAAPAGQRGVQCMTMHRAKGLEFKAVAMTRLGAKEMRLHNLDNLEGEELEQARARERNLLYVAGSRARENLALLWSGEPVSLLAGAMEPHQK